MQPVMRHCGKMDTTNYFYNEMIWKANSTVSDKNSFFHAAFGVRANENEPYLDKRANNRRCNWASFLRYFEAETMPGHLVDMLKKCLNANEKYKRISIEDQDHLDSYVVDIMNTKHDVTIEEIPILAALENIKIVLFKDWGSEPVAIIKPDTEVLGSYPYKTMPKGEVVLHMRGNVFSRMNPLVEDPLLKPTEDEDKMTDERAAKESSGQSERDLIKYKKVVTTVSEEVQFKVGVLIVFFLNALKKLRNWKISTENTAVGKFDNVVIQWSEGSTLLQVQHKQNNKEKELVSTNLQNDDFSILQYFLSFLEIKKKFKLKETIICTNATVSKNIMKFLKPQKVNPESLLYYENCDCKSYTFNKENLPSLTTSIQAYPNKVVDKSIITTENISDFLNNLQIYSNYSLENNNEELTKQLLFHMKRLKHVYVNVSSLEIQDWFQSTDDVYLTELMYAKAILSEIWRDQHMKTLRKYNIYFKCNDRDFQNAHVKIFHVAIDDGYLLHEIKIFQMLVSSKTKFLFTNLHEDTEKQKHVIEAFDMPQYTILVLVCPKNAQELLIKETSYKLRDILVKYRYKKVVLIADRNNKIPQLVGLSYDVIKESIAFENLSKDSRERFLEKYTIIFQGIDISFKQLFPRQATEDYAKLLTSKWLENLIKGEKIRLGAPVKSDGYIMEFYITRKFERRLEIFSEEQICEMNEKVMLISNNAGMGKSTVLTNLAATMKKNYPHLWVIRVDLNDYTQVLKEFLGKNKNTINILELLNSKRSTELKNQLERVVFSMKEKVALMFDGFDEISPDYTQLVLSLLSLSREQRNIAKVIVTTRPQLAGVLEEELQVEPFSLLPFSKQNQIDFLVEYWTHNLDVDNTKRSKCENYAKALIEKMSSWKRLYGQETNNFVAVPLHVRMLAEIFQFEMSENGKGCKIELKQFANKNITTLYDMYIKKKRNVFIDKGNPGGNSVNDEFEKYLTYHRSLALELSFDKKQCELFSCRRQIAKNVEIDVLRMDIVVKVDDEFHFTHRTFAEYFVATSLKEELYLSNKNVEFQKFLIEEMLLKSQFYNIQYFFDSFLTDDSYHNTIHNCQFVSYKISSFGTKKLSCINNIVGNGLLAIFQLILKCADLNFFTKTSEQFFDTPAVESFPKYTNILKVLQQKALDAQSTDTAATFLELAAAGGHLEMVKFLVQQGAKVNAGDFKPIHIAVASGHLEMVKYLVEHGADVTAKDSIYSTTTLDKAVLRKDVDMSTYLMEKIRQSDGSNKNDFIIPYMAAYLGRLDILKELKPRLDGRGKDGETIIFGAVRGGQLEIVKYLVQQAYHDINSRDYENNTALHVISQETKLVSTAELLVMLGIDVNAKNFKLSTALHIALKAKNYKMAKFLIIKDADVNLADQTGTTALHIAVRTNNFDMVQLLVNRKADVNLKDKEGTTALHIAVKEKSVNMVKLLVTRDTNLNLANQQGSTALHIAVEKNCFDLVELLLDSGADVSLEDVKGNTVLHIAAQNLRRDIMEFLLSREVDINSKNKYGYTVLYTVIDECSIRFGDVDKRPADYLDFIKFLIKSGADVSAKNSNGWTVLHLAAFEGQLDITTLLVRSGADVAITNKDGRTALHLAAINGYTDVVQYLVQHSGYSSNISDKEGYTVLHYLAYFNPRDSDRRDAIRPVIENGEDVNIRGNDGRTALHLATKWDDLDAVILLVESGSDVNIKDNTERTALHMAASEGNIEIAKLLVQYKVDVNIQDVNGHTALHAAASKNHVGITRFLLLQKGVDVDIRDKAGHTALHLAVLKGHLEVTKVLVNESDQTTDEHGNTILHWAVHANRLDIVEFLVDLEIDVDAKNNEGRSALHLAADRDYLDIAEFLINHGAYLNVPDKRGSTALHLAACCSLDLVTHLVEQGADVYLEDCNGDTAAIVAKKNDCIDTFKYLKEHSYNFSRNLFG